MTTVTCSCCGGRVMEQGFVRLHSHHDTVICYSCLDWLNARRDKKIAAAGGGAWVMGHEPCFTVADLPRAVDHYQRLGFRTSHYNERYAFARRDRLTIHLAQAAGESPGHVGVLYLHVDDADQLAAEWRKAGVAVTGPEDREWGFHEGAHTDPDGNKIRFGSPVQRPDSS